MTLRRTARSAGWLSAAGLFAVALVAPAATLATTPTAHQVTICHATNSDTNPYLQETVDIASSGHLRGGHDVQHTGPIWNATLKDQHISWGDIIPPYTYLSFSFPGMNWSADGQAIWSNGCAVAALTSAPTGDPSTSPSGDPSTSAPSGDPSTSAPSGDPSTSAPSGDPSAAPSSDPSNAPIAGDPSSTASGDPSTSPSGDPSSTASGDPSSSPSGDPSTAPGGDPSTAPGGDASTAPGDPSAAPVGSVLGLTGTPQVTPPPTDAVAAPDSRSGSSWQLLLLAAVGILAGTMVLTPATARKRR